MIQTWFFFVMIGLTLIFFGKKDLKKAKREGNNSSFGYSTNVSLIILGMVFLIGAFFKIIGI